MIVRETVEYGHSDSMVGASFGGRGESFVVAAGEETNLRPGKFPRAFIPMGALVEHPTIQLDHPTIQLDHPTIPLGNTLPLRIMHEDIPLIRAEFADDTFINIDDSGDYSQGLIYEAA